MRKNRFLLLAIISLLIWNGCEDSTTEPTIIDPVEEGIVVLNEGLYGMNNASLTFFDNSDSITTQYVYRKANGNKNLGDTGNDMVQYGNKLLIAVDKSNKLEIINKTTFKTVRTIDLGANGSPREILLIDSLEAYVSSAYRDLVFKVNPTTGEILSTVSVGSKPEGLALTNGKIYVANSGFVFGTTVSVLSHSSFEQIKEITVGQNPRYVFNDNQMHIYVICSGKWDNDGRGGIYKIDTNTDTVIDSLIMFKNPGEACFISDNEMLVANAEALYMVNTETMGITKTIISADKINAMTGTIYSLSYDIDKELIYCGNSKDNVQNGEIVVIDKRGNEVYRFDCGINPGTILKTTTN